MVALVGDLNYEFAKRFPQIKQSFKEHKEEGLYFWFLPIKKHLPNGWVDVEGHGPMIMLGGYSYLGLLNHPEINRKAKDAIDLFGTGTQGSPLLAGTLSLRVELERALAQLKKTEDAVSFSSGYVTNLATIMALVGRRDVVICDKMNHASIVDGCRASGARFLRFHHNDMDSLEMRLKNSATANKRLVIVDAVYSMEGDIANLPDIRFLCDRYNANLMVDEAHSVGVIGKRGLGIEEHFDMPPDTIDLKMGTLSKAIPSNGGYIAASGDICNFLRHTARGLVFSGAPSGPVIAAALTGISILNREPERVAKLHNNAAYFKQRLDEMGINTGKSETAIIPIICGKTETTAQLARYCQDRKLFIHSVYPPVVPPGTARLRVSIMADHSLKDLDYCLDVIHEGTRKLEFKFTNASEGSY